MSPFLQSKPTSMKKTFLLLAMLSGPLSGFAQQIPINSQQFINKHSLSPAFAGFNRNFEVFAGMRQDWVGIPGAPETKWFTANAAMTDATGFGLTFLQQNVSLFEQLTARFDYAYHTYLDRKTTMSFALSAGLFNQRVDWAQIRSPLADPYLPQLQDLHGTAIDMGFGLMLARNGLTVGLGMPRAVATPVSHSVVSSSDFTLARQYMAHVSYLLPLDRELAIEPIVVLRSTERSGMFFDLGMNANFRKKVWGGANFRTNGSLGFFAGYSPHPQIVVNYHYEFRGSEIQNMGNGSHELSVGFNFKHGKTNRPSIFVPLGDTINDLEYRVSRLERRVPALERKVQEHTEQIAELQRRLEECCNDNEEQELRRRIEQLQLELEKLRLESAREVEFETPFILQNIQFATDSDVLEPSSFASLNNLVAELKAKPGRAIKVVGYTDNMGDPAYNLDLSKRRALSVKNYLVSQGIDPARVLTDGKGMGNPIAPNDTPQGRAVNRRIEVSFTR